MRINHEYYIDLALYLILIWVIFADFFVTFWAKIDENSSSDIFLSVYLKK